MAKEDRNKPKLSVERLVLIVSILVNVFQVVSDEAQEWVAMSKQSGPDRRQMTLNIEEVNSDSTKIEKALGVK